MYKILNKLFGWDYIYWKSFASQGIARVHTSPIGKVWYFRYKNIEIIDTIDTPDQVLWLTCNPDKYLPCKLKT